MHKLDIVWLRPMKIVEANYGLVYESEDLVAKERIFAHILQIVHYFPEKDATKIT